MEGQLLTPVDFRELVFINPAQMHLRMNPRYFDSTAIEAHVASLSQQRAPVAV